VSASSQETLSSTKQALLRQWRRGRAVPAAVGIPRRTPGAEAPLSFTQERLWLLHQLEPQSPAYNMTGAYRLEGDVCLAAFAEAVSEVCRLHETLRTRFVAWSGRPVQVIDPFHPVVPPVVDLSALGRERVGAEADRLAREESLRPFDLAAAVPLRLRILRLAAAEHLIVATLHHIAGDGWSVRLLVEQVTESYRARVAGQPGALPELPIQYADFAAWQREHLAGDRLQALLDHWRARLAGATAPLGLPTDKPRPAVLGNRGVRCESLLAPELLRDLHRLARGEECTLFMVLLAGFQLLLSRYSGEERISVGSPIASRDSKQLERLIGFFANTLVLRTDLSGDPELRELLARARTVVTGAFGHHEVPFDLLVQELAPERDLAHNPLFQVALALQAGALPELQLGTARLVPHPLPLQTAKFDLFLSCTETPAGLLLELESNTDLFELSTALRLLTHLETLLRGAVAEPRARLADLPLLSAAERWQVTGEWNETAWRQEGEATIHGLFAAQVAARAGSVALVFVDPTVGTVRTTYGELAERADALAERLRRLDVGPEARVGVLLERSPEAIVCLLAVLKAGGAYVPLDPAWPEERLRLLLDDTGCAAVATRSGLAGHPVLDGRPHLLVDAPDMDAPATEAGWPPAGAEPDSLAYVMYTSGSQGRPKGVAVSHRGVVRLVERAGYARFGPREVWLQLAPLSFDASTLEIWGALLHGGTLVIAPPGALSPAELGDLVAGTGVTSLWLTAGFFHQVAEAGMPGLSGLRQLLAGGDVVSPSHARRLLEHLPGCTLINGYGPTENTTFTCCHPLAPGDAVGASVPIGRPIEGTSAHLVDSSLQPVPVCVPGELLTGGAGLARGYWGRPGLTAERFVPDPLGAPGGRLYRTGDLARRRGDGRIEFLGRMDGQVKVRGFRIEPGEIETALARHPAVRECAVAALPDRSGEKRLVAWCVAPEAEPATLRGFLQESLPSHLVPTTWVLLDRLPLTANGKVDRRALPAPDETGAAAEGATAPRTIWEELVSGVFREVLGLAQVGLVESFFERGGHSLLATQAVSRLRELTGAAVELRWIFESPSVGELAARLAEAAARPLPPIERADRGAPLPASFAQERLWLVEQMQAGTAAYNVYQAVRLEGDLAVPALAAALAEVVRRHEALRTVFRNVDGRPLQEILPEADAVLRVVDLSGLAADTAEAEWKRKAGEEIDRPFDLENGPLVRWVLFRRAADEHLLLVQFHHISSDGWSMGVLLREVSQLYAGSPLPELEVQYADYALWQRGWLRGNLLDEEIAWWRGHLHGAPRALDLPLDRQRPAVRSLRGATLPVRWGAATVARLEGLARRNGATLFMVLLSGFDALLARLSGQQDVVVGTPVANRSRCELEDLIGFFVNTLALRTDLSGDPGFGDLLGRVRIGTLAALSHQDVPFEKLVGELAPERDLSQSALFQVVLALQNAPLPEVGLGGLHLSLAGLSGRTSKFDLTLGLTPFGGELIGFLEYSTDLFETATIQRLLGHLEALLAAATGDDRLRLHDLPLLSEAERWQLTGEWNDAAWEQEGEGTAHALFLAQAAVRPDAVALVSGERRTTYGELVARAGALAHRLSAAGVGPEVRVAVLLERSEEAVVAILAVLLAGGAYVPLDPAWPEERLRLLLDDTGCALVATRGGFVDHPALAGRRHVLVDAEAPAVAGPLPAVEVGSDHLAYIMYTSGSQGRPKGVAVVHRGIVRLVERARYARFGPEEVWLQLAPLSFDASTLEIWGALLHGGTLVIAPPGALSPAELGELVEGSGVTALWLTAGFFHQVVESGMAGLSGLRQLLAGGDVVSPSHARRLLETLPGCTLINGYGPTENTTFTCCHPMEAADSIGTSVPIGRPITGTSVHLADRAFQPVPVGVPGELLTGGDGLARGYWGRPELTAEKLIPDPLGAPGGRLYRTGDLARRRGDGSIEFLGRIDGQVKVRGFRIEPGEIEAALARHPAVRECAIAALPDHSGGKRLVAYYAAAEGTGAGELRAFLQETLPPYLIPTTWVDLETLPLNANGKVDRRALPAPESVGLDEANSESLVAPSDPVEELVAGIWAEVLGHDRFGAHDDFFALGGHSLLATQVVSRIREMLGAELPLRRLFEAPTVAGLARALREAGSSGTPPIVPVPRDRDLPLSFAQQRLWLLDRLEPGSSAYTVPLALRLTGALSVGLLERAFAEIVRRHEVLRTTFEARERGPVQVIAPPSPTIPLPLIDLSADPEREARVQALALEEARRPFDLRRGPLLRLLLVRLAEREHILLVTLHHIVSDGWSMGVLLREVAALHEGSPLPALPQQYADFAVWQRSWLQGEVLEAQLDHWKRQLAGAPAVLELPLDRPRPATQTFRGAARPAALGPGLSDAMGRLCRHQGVTPFMALLGAWAVLLGRHAGQADVVLGTPIAGRNRREIEPLIGFFVNTLALRLDLSGNPSFSELLEQVRRTALDSFSHQDLPFERIVEEIVAERNLAVSPLFQVMFALQNAPLGELALPGLELSPVGLDAGIAKFDLSLVLQKGEAGFAGTLDYNTDLFDRTTADRMLEQLLVLLAGVVEHPGRRLLELPLLTESERHQVLLEWAASRFAPAEGGLVQDLFRARAAQSHSAVALVAGGSPVTYGELAEQVERLARHLSRQGVGPEVVVGICLDAPADIVTAMLAVLRSGGTFLPLDPAYPEERLCFILDDAGAALKLDSLPGVPADEAAPAPVRSLPENLAYVIYTSGTTGRPKGVGITHQTLVPMLLWGIETFGLGRQTRVLQNLAPWFDFGVFEILTTLLAGGTLYIPDERKDASRHGAFLRAHRINTLHSTPSFFREVLTTGEALPDLEVLHVGGEALFQGAVQRMFDVVGERCHLYNGYGPTEATISCSIFDAGTPGERRDRGAAAIPIGRATGRHTLYVRDRNGDPTDLAGIGVPGELWVGGEGLARGYLNRPGLTAERFQPDPFSSTPGARLYRTGDLVRSLPTGDLEFLGRIDQQVKLRGLRIELGEIETVLASHPRIREVVVLVHEDRPGDQRLVAYVASTADNQPTAEELRQLAGTHLPAGLVPSAFVFLDAFPRSATGKVDRKALPAPQATGSVSTDLTAPFDPIEELLAGIWVEVLRVDRVGIHESFFALGGHSLLATQVVSRVRSVFGIELPLRVLFEEPTIASLARQIAAHRGSVALPPITRAGRSLPMPLSFAQERLWFLEQLAPGLATYNIPGAVRLSGDLDEAALVGALREIVRRHESLRTRFPESAGAPVQEIEPEIGKPLPVVDLASLPEAARRVELERRIGAEAALPFDLRQGPLLRLLLVRETPAEHVLACVMHHIVSDGWSLGIFISELATLYEALAAGRPSPLPELEVQYADFAVWQRSALGGDGLARQLGFWREALEGAPGLLELPADHPRPPVQSFRGGQVPLDLEDDLAAGVSAQARERGATPFMVLLAAFQVLLARLSGQEDVLVGSPVASRNHAETERLIGFFVNTLVFRGQLAGGPRFGDLLARTRESTLEAYGHQELPFEKLVEELAPQRSLAYSPLFQVFFALQNLPPARFELSGLTLAPVELDSRVARFDLSLTLAPRGDGLRGAIEHSADLFEGTTVSRLAAGFRTALRHVLADPELPVREVPLLGEAERQQLVAQWNDTAVAYPRERCVHELFLERAWRTPLATALVFQDQRLSFGELAARAGRLARRLRRLGVGPDSVVGLSTERSLDMVVGVLGILEAGAAYLPLDPSYPAERLSAMLDDGGAAVVVLQEHLREPLAGVLAGRTVAVLGEEAGAGPVPVTGASAEQDNLAYLLFTSGSTGRPKGVQITRRSFVNLLTAMARWPGLSADDVVVAIATLSFDIASFELIAPLLAGARVIIAPAGTAGDGAALGALLDRERATLLQATPASWRLLLESGWRGRRGLRILSGGEAMSRELADRLLGCSEPPAGLWNLYGPTETTIYSTGTRMTAGGGPVTIGRPIANTRAQVLDRYGNLLPPGVPGELWLGGDGLARGYAGQPHLTAERFLPDPFSGAPGARLYRTGDLVRLRADGAIEYLGRIDHQVKVRGFRIELGEIESALLATARVARAIAIVREGRPGDRRIVAYVVAEEGAEADPAALRRGLRTRLPEHMLPSEVVVLERLPLSPNGKVDRAALPAPEAVRTAIAAGAPRTIWEELVGNVFAEVLGRVGLGVEESFFEAGGHSLLATRVVSRLRALSGREVELRWLFESPSISGLAARLEVAAGTGRLLPPPRPRRAAAQPAPLSFAQERLWFLETLQPGTGAYNVAQALCLTGPLDAAALERSLREVVRRHEALRTVIRTIDGEPVQVVAPDLEPAATHIDLSGLPDADAEWRRLAAGEAARPFDLERGPLVRWLLIRRDADDHVLVLALHHIVTDAWSFGVLLGEVATLYGAFARGASSPLPALELQYADYAAWQREYLAGDLLAAEVGFWRERLAGAPAGLELPADRPRLAVQSLRGASLPVAWRPELVGRLEALGRRTGATLFMVVLAGLDALLAQMSGQEDVLVGTPVAHRTHREVEGLIGFFVNTLVLRTDLSGAPSFAELVARVREAALAAYGHQDLPFEKLVEELAPERSLGHSALFQVMLAHQNTPVPEVDLGGVRLSSLDLPAGTSKFDLTLSLTPDGGWLRGFAEHSTDLFDGTTVLRLVARLETLLAAACAEPGTSVRDLPLLPAAERFQLLTEWNDTAVRFDTDECLYDLFAAQAARTPDTIALEQNGERMTYRELDARARRLARHLRGLGVGPDQVVGLCVERSPRMVVGLLGVLAAGGGYLPLDPSYPDDRLAFMVADSGAAVVLSETPLRGKLGDFAGTVVLLDAPEHERPPAGDEARLAPAASPESLAYVLYTSGSTGRPKGAMIPHSAIVNHMEWMQRRYPLGPEDAVLQKTPFSFDASVWEFYAPLLVGGRLVLARPGAHRDPADLAAEIARRQVRILQVVPTLLDLLLEEPRFRDCVTLKRVYCGGEALTAEVERRFFAQLGADLINVYGPTEATIHSASWEARAEHARGAATAVPIGVPIDNGSLRILDPQGAPVPIGVPGQLFVGGANLGRGYLGRPELTAERFVPDPFAQTGGARLYASGDLVRYLPDGRLEFLGRLDHQVKLRGFRIELGEIESSLLAAPGVRQAVVVVRDETGSQALAAYVIAEEGAEPDPRDLRLALQAALPAYMVPETITRLERLPLLPNGKLDRRALPTPDRSEERAAGPAAAPRTPLEAMLRDLWSEILGAAGRLRSLGIHDDFFAVGGHSLSAARLVARLRTLLGQEVPLRALFEAPTIAGLAARLEDLRGTALPPAPPIARVPRTGPLLLASGQERLWFLEALQPGSAAYNLPLAARLRGDLDVAAVAAALGGIERRHESLRTSFPAPAGRPEQRISPPSDRTPCLADLSGLPAAARQAEALRLSREEIGRAFDLATGPLWRTLLLRHAAREHDFLLAQHHIIGDGWSTGLLLGEFGALYAAAVTGQPAALPALPLQYADYAAWQQEWLRHELFERQIEIWRERLAGAPTVMELPLDRPRPAVQSSRGAAVEVLLPESLAEATRSCGRRGGATLFMVLLTAFQTLLARLSGQEELLVGTPVAGRGRAELENLIGLFANTLVLRGRLGGDPTFGEALARLRSEALEAFADQELPFEKLVERVQPERDLSRSPLFQVLFSLQNVPLPRLVLPGLDLEPIGVPSAGARFDLALEVTEVPQGLSTRWEHNTDLFDTATVRRMAEQLSSLLHEAVIDPGRPLSRLALLSEPERHQALVEWNDTEIPLTAEPDLVTAFEAQVDRAPDHPVLVCDDRTLTWRELDERANALAHLLAVRGAGPDTVVGVCLPRTSDLVVTLLAVLKTGGAYLPLDPAYPAERLALMLADSQAPVVVSTHELAADLVAGLATAGAALLDIGELGADAASSRRPAVVRAPESLAYVIYTSGSTGRPKGVMVPQGGVANFFRGMDALIGRTPGTWLAVTSVSFDISVLEILWTLTRGFRIVLQHEQAQLAAGRDERTSRGARGGRTLDFSLFFFASEERDEPQKYRLLFDAARFADEHGFAAVWTPERHFHAFGGIYPNPSVAGAALAARTERVQIRAGSVVLPLHHPIRVAEDWAVVDNISNGRAGISFASGWHPDDFVFAPQSYARRKELMFEGIETIRRLWRGEAVEAEGGAGRPVQVRIRPRPVQPELPVWVTAAGSPDTFRMAGEIGAHVLTHLLGQDLDVLAENIAVYRAAWRPAPGGPAEGKVSLMLHTFVAPDLDFVRETVRAPFTAYLRSAVGLLRGLAAGLGQDMDSAEFSEDDLQALLAHAFERYFGTSSLFGTPETCRAMVDRLRSAGVDEAACLVDFGVEAETVLANLRHLDEVRRNAERPAHPAGADRSLAAQVESHGITHLQCTPSMASLLALDPEALAALGRLDRLLLGGEALPPALLDRLHESGPREIHNMYGPTETTIWSTTRRLDPAPGVPVTIGRAIANTSIHLLDRRGAPVPVGVPGELLIGGAGVVRGYLGRPELTAERFVPDPWSAAPGGRLYRTGDLARFRPDGEIDFLGRLDHQVKIRGFRIELEEIEVAIGRHPGVREAVVVAREDRPGDRRLVAYWIAAETGAPDAAGLRSLLSRSLPDYMVPAAFVRVDSFPLTPNRKIDRKALPAPEVETAVEAAAAAPRTELERLLAGVWADVLRRDRVGVHDNFFELGGHSLLATQLLLRVREIAGRDVPLRLVFEAPTIAAMAERIEGLAQSESGIERPPLAAVERHGRHPLSYAQQRIWVLDQLSPGNWAYNDHSAVRLRGALDLAALRRSLTEIVRRHEVLRTNLETIDRRPYQMVRPPQEQPLPVQDLSGLPEELRAEVVSAAVREQARYVFDLAADPLLRLSLLKLAPEEHVLVLVVHHVVWDGWSMMVFVRELTELYDAFSRGLASPLPELPVQYLDYAEWQSGWLQGETLNRLLGFWRDEIAGVPQTLHLPTDRPRPPVQTFRGTRHALELPAGLAPALHNLDRQEGVTLFMTLLAGFEALLFHASGQEEFLVGTDVANRAAIETEQLIGFFVNQIVLRADLREDPTFGELLKRTRRAALAGFAHQDLPFDRLVSGLQMDRDLARTPLFQVKLVLQNVPPQTDGFSGLELRPLELDWGSAKFDLLLNLTEAEGTITGSLEYSSDLFDPATVQKLCTDFGRLLELAVAEPTLRLSELRDRLTALEEQERAHHRSRRARRSLDLLQKVKKRGNGAPRPAERRAGDSENEA
jgi:natural product biosynthesis luciferase-like monooxygenase protein/amino acid adenylation domain-containing protein